MKGIRRFPAPPVRPMLGIFLALFLSVSCASVPPVVSPGSNGLREGAAKELESNYAGAMESYREYLYSLPESADRVPAYRKLARCAMKLGDTRQAREFYQRALRGADSDEARFEATKGIGESYYRENRHWLAARHFASAERYERNPLVLDEIWYKLAVCHQKTGDEALAGEYFTKVRKYRPAAGEPVFEQWSAKTGDGGEAPPARAEAAGLDVLPRESWKARPMRPDHDPMGRVSRITVHHSAIPETQRDFDSSSRSIRSIQTVHMGIAHGWADIGYHYLIDRAGRIWRGRPEYIQGAHAGNPEANRGNIGICLLGDYSAQEPTLEQKSALRSLLLTLIGAHGISVDQLYTHQEMRQLYRLAPTECPGERLQAFVDSLRDELRRGRRAGSDAPVAPSLLHHVNAGETLSQISRRYGVSVADLRRVNRLAADGRIEVGQRLRIPR
jgi:tetratricopeptide (TPR) repeat protein